MNPLNVLVYDDQPKVAVTWKSHIETAYCNAKITTATKEDFRSLMRLLNRRRHTWRKSEGKSSPSKSHPADLADVIVVDYDLIDYSKSTDTTGSRLAYLLRCFSSCGFIIILNEYGTNVFDFSLSSPTEDFADIHVGDEQIGNPGLWQAEFRGYRPWHWPVVPHARKNFEQCVNDVVDNPEEPMLEFLDLNRVIDWIPRRAREFLQSDQKMENVTFRGFIESTRRIAAKDTLTPRQLARTAAARISTLLNSIILPDQSLLVDAPHLASRFPSLLMHDRDNIVTWNALCNPVNDGINDLLHECLRKHRFKRSHWLWRPAWYWPTINGDQNIEEVANPWAVEETKWVFCENISRFVPADVAQEFRALVSPPFIKRFVFKSDSPDAERYVSQVGKGGPLDPSQVDYSPEAVLSW